MTTNNRYWNQPWYTKIYRTVIYVLPFQILGIVKGIYWASRPSKWDEILLNSSTDFNNWAHRFKFVYDNTIWTGEKRAGKWLTLDETMDLLRAK